MMLSESRDSAAGLLWNPGRYRGWRRPAAAAKSVTHFYLSREKEGRSEGNGRAATLAQTKNRRSQLQQRESGQHNTSLNNFKSAISVCTVLCLWHRTRIMLECNHLVYKQDLMESRHKSIGLLFFLSDWCGRKCKVKLWRKSLCV